MRTLFYHYNSFGVLVLNYRDNDRWIDHSYLYYSLREALAKFRKDYNLQHKHIKIIKLH